MEEFESNKREHLLSSSTFESTEKILSNIFKNSKNKVDQTSKFYSYYPTTTNLLDSLRVQKSKGLDMTNEQDIAERRAVFSSFDEHNYICHSFFDHLKASFKDELLIDLFEASAILLLLGIIKEGVSKGWIDAFSIMVSVLIIAPISALFNYQKEKKFENLTREISNKNVLVRRNGVLMSIKEKELLTGDIMKIQPGDVINVSGVLISGHILCFQPSKNKTLDINSEDKENNIINPSLSVNQGNGDMVVILLKDNKKEDKDENKHDEIEEENLSDLELQMHNISQSFGLIGFIMGIVVGVIMLVKTLIYNYYKNIPLFDIEILVVLVDAFIISVVLFVIAFPEGLPMAGQISIAFSISKMIDDKVLINHYDKISTLSKLNFLLINKSSVTEGNPKVEEFFAYGSENNRKGISNMINHIVFTTNNSIILINNHLFSKGEPIDNALLNLVIENCNEEYLKKNFVENEDKIREQILFQIPFNNAYNYSLSFVKNPSLSSKNPYIAYLKGYADSVLKMCSCYTNLLNNFDIDNSINSIIEKYITKCYNVILLAEKETSSLEISDDFYKDFKLVAILGIKDSIMMNNSEALKKLEMAGIYVKMLTSENIETSLKACEKIGLLKEREVKTTKEQIKAKNEIQTGKFIGLNIFKAAAVNLVSGMIGKDYIDYIGGYNKSEISPYIDDNSSKKPSSISSVSFYVQQYKYELKDLEKFKQSLRQVKLLANISIEERQVLISGIKQLNPKQNIVGITYNGIYDSDDTSLQLADVTFSSSLSSSNLINEKGDVILLSRSLQTIILSLIHARNIYDSIRKFIQYQLTISIVTVAFSTLGSFFFIDVPLSPIQLLWINLIMDSLGALALATDPPDEEMLLKYKPYSGQLFNRAMIYNITGQVLYQLITLLIFLYYGDKILGLPSDRQLKHHEWNEVNGYQISFIFNLFIFMQIFNLINCRKVHPKEFNIFRGIFKNKFFLIVFSVITGIQIAFLNLGGRVMRTHPLNWNLQGLCIGIASISLIVNFVGKLVINDYDLRKEKITRKKKIEIILKGE